MSDTAARPLRRDAVENRAAILDAARIVLNADPDAGLEAIAAEAGLTRRSLYGHFASRDELVRELIANGAARVAAAVGSVDHEDPLVRLGIIAAGLWREVADIRVMAVLAARGPFARTTAAALAGLRLRVLTAVTEAQDLGTVRRDVQPGVLANLVENAALGVLDESARWKFDTATGHRLVIAMVFGMLGLSASEAAAVAASAPELAGPTR
ncbi:TetR/AcrR family transcriptional regulator [Naasia lichenicola]|nr:TetR/AcrR family transcriptional regulator [Naasia lichenicola]